MESRIVREILKKNEEFLRRHLVLSKTVLDKLYQQGILADIMRRKILMYPAHKQVPLLIENLENRGLSSLRKFLEVLKDTGHSYLVDIILDTEAIPVHDVRPSTQTHAGGRDHHLAARPTHTVHGSHRPANNTTGHHMASLNSLLRLRQDQEMAPRGSIVPRTLLTNPAMLGHHGAEASGGYGMAPVYQQPPPPPPGYGAHREDLPGTLYTLGQAFSTQLKQNEQSLIVLRQEEMAIKQLLEQNARDQQKLRRKQYTMNDLNQRLADINARATDMYEPGPHPNISRYRLAQLNQIPWSVDN